ncbi:hypothetical protein JP0178_04220 [Helicobacter pylori]
MFYFRETILLWSRRRKNLTKASCFYSKACDLNNGSGCGGLGFLYGSGKGVEKNLIKAAQFYSKACELKEGDGCGALGGGYIIMGMG